MESPRFFVDRSLGRVRVPRLLREDGWDVVTLAEHYGIPADEAVQDIDWLTLAGEQGWAVLMKDDRIRYRGAERAALTTSGVAAFCLASANLNVAAMAGLFISHRTEIWRRAADGGPAFYAISRAGIRRVDLD